VDPRLFVSVAVGRVDCAADLLIGNIRRTCQGRIHFPGCATDGRFSWRVWRSAMRWCFPYIGGWTILFPDRSRNRSKLGLPGDRLAPPHTFLQFARYHPNMVEFFDIGINLELAGAASWHARNSTWAGPPARVQHVGGPTRPTYLGRQWARCPQPKRARSRTSVCQALKTRARAQVVRIKAGSGRSGGAARSTRPQPSPLMF